MVQNTRAGRVVGIGISRATFLCIAQITLALARTAISENIVWWRRRFSAATSCRQKWFITRTMCLTTTGPITFRCLTPTQITFARPWSGSARSGRLKVGNASWSQCGAEVDPPPVAGQNKVVQRATNLAAVTQAKRIQVVTRLYERPVGLGWNTLAVHQRVHPKWAADLTDDPVQLGDGIPHRLIPRQTSVASDHNPFACHATMELFLFRHWLVEPDGLNTTFRDLLLQLLHGVQRVLRHARNRGTSGRRRGYLWVLAH